MALRCSWSCCVVHIQWQPIIFSIPVCPDGHSSNMASVRLCVNRTYTIRLYFSCHFCFLLSRIRLRGLLIIADSQTQYVITGALPFITSCLPSPARSARWCHTPLCAQIPITFRAVMSCDPISTGLDHHWHHHAQGRKVPTVKDKYIGNQIAADV